MYYELKVNDDKSIFAEDFQYKLYNDEINTISIIGIFYASKDYEFLTKLLDVPISISLYDNDVLFAKLENVVLNEVEYHLKNDEVNFYGTFEEYREDVNKLEDKELRATI